MQKLSFSSFCGVFILSILFGCKSMSPQSGTKDVVVTGGYRAILIWNAKDRDRQENSVFCVASCDKRRIDALFADSRNRMDGSIPPGIAAQVFAFCKQEGIISPNKLAEYFGRQTLKDAQKPTLSRVDSDREENLALATDGAWFD